MADHSVWTDRRPDPQNAPPDECPRTDENSVHQHAFGDVSAMPDNTLHSDIACGADLRMAIYHCSRSYNHGSADGCVTVDDGSGPNMHRPNNYCTIFNSAFNALQFQPFEQNVD